MKNGTKGNKLRSPGKTDKQTFKVVDAGINAVPPTPQPPFFTFKTTFEGEVSFSITQVPGETAIWYMGDGTILTNTNSVTHIYTEPGEKTVSVAVGDFADVTGLGSFAAKNITQFDASGLNNLSSTLIFNGNPALTTFAFPNSHSNTITGINFSDCNLTGTINLSTVNISNSIVFNQNPNINQITFGNQTNLGRLECNNCNITGVLNLSTAVFTGVTVGIGTRNISFVNNPSLTQVIFSSAQVTTEFNQFNADSCNLESLNLSMFYPGFFRTLNVPNNVNLTTSVLPPSNSVPSTNKSNINFENCNITGVFDISHGAINSSAGRINVRNNPLLTGIAFASMTNYVVRSNAPTVPSNGLVIENTAIEHIDMSGLASWRGDIFVKNCTDLLSYSDPINNGLNGQIRFIDCPSIISIEAVTLVGTCNNMIIQNCIQLASLAFGAKTTVSLLIENIGLASLDLSPLVVGGGVGSLVIKNNPHLASLILPQLENPIGPDCTGNPNLQICEFSSIIGPWPNGAQRVLDITNAKLNQLSVDKLLVTYAAQPLTINSSQGIRLNGGTSAPPSDGSITGFDGIAAKALIISLNNICTTN